jgi:hypothetical protein
MRTSRFRYASGIARITLLVDTCSAEVTVRGFTTPLDVTKEFRKHAGRAFTWAGLDRVAVEAVEIAIGSGLYSSHDFTADRDGRLVVAPLP